MALLLDQERVLTFATKGHNVLVTGQCGTGKSHTLRAVVRNLISQGKKVSVTCTTGMATIQFQEFKACTIHHWAGLQDGKYSKEELAELLLGSDKYRYIRDEIRQCDVLVIDEIGMLSKHNFENIEYICRKVKDNNTLFGSLQVLASGSFKQLRPVPNHSNGDCGEYCFLSPEFPLVFPHHIHLTQVIRQDEPDLKKAVDELCNGCPSDSSVKLLKDLCRPLEVPDGEYVTELYGTNFDVDFVNHEKLDTMFGESVTYTANDSGNIKLLRKCNWPKYLRLKIGAPVTLLINHSVAHGLVNGLVGKIVQLTNDGPKIDFNNKVYTITRHSFKMHKPGSKQICTERLQYPLKLAFALTVHRAIGLTLPLVIVDCYSFFQPGQMGVAIGRSVCKSGLQVLNYNSVAAHMKHPPEVYAFYDQILNTQIVCEHLLCCTVPVTDKKTEEAHNKSESDIVESLEPHTSFDISEVDDYGEFPLVIEEFLARVQSVADTPHAIKFNEACSEMGQHTNSKEFFKFIWDVACHIFHSSKYVSPRSASGTRWRTMFAKSHAFLGSDKYTKKVCTISSESPTPDQYRICSRSVMLILELLTEKESISVVNEHNQNKSDTENDVSETMTDAVRAKVRYIAGATLATTRTRLRDSLKQKFRTARTNIRRKNLFVQYKLLLQLQNTETEITETTFDPVSLNEILNKQGTSHGLTHVSDDTYEFFLNVFRMLRENLQPEHWHFHISSIHARIRQKIYTDENLIDKWLNLFSIQCEDSVDTELQLGMLMDLYTTATDYFVKVLLSDSLVLFKESIPRKKKQALRPSLQSQSKQPTPNDPIPSVSDNPDDPIPSTSSSNLNDVVLPPTSCVSNDLYTCGVCNEVCKEENNCSDIADFSIGCDGSCDAWYHYHCVNIIGTEPFLQKKRSKWFCANCMADKASKKKRNKKK